MATHQETLDRKREEESKKEKTGSTNSNREVLINDATLICPYSLSIGILKVTSNEILTQNKICATEGDANGSINLQFEGLCMHPKWGSKKPMCKDVIKLEKWQGVGNAIYQEQRVLIKGSSIACNPTQNVPSLKPIPKAENFALSDSTNQENTSSKPGYYYQKDGTFLGKIDNSENVFITDKATFDKIKNKETVKASLVIAFTEKCELTNKQLLDRAHWIFGEGGASTDSDVTNPAIYFAWAQKNQRIKMNKNKPNLTLEQCEEEIKKSYWKDATHSYSAGNIFTKGKSDSQYNTFNNARMSGGEAINKLKDIDVNTKKEIYTGIRSIGAVISVELNLVNDPIGGNTSWVSASGEGKDNPTYNNKIPGRINPIKIKTSTRWWKASTIFYSNKQ